MALEIPKLQEVVPIAEPATGRPTYAFHRWWSEVAAGVENAFNKLIENLIRVGVLTEEETIASNKVTTNSIVPDAVTERYATLTVVPIDLPDGVETEILMLAVVKAISSSEMDLDVAVRFESTDDIRGDLLVYRDGLVIDAFSPRMDGAGKEFRTVLTLPFTEFNVPAGPYTYSVRFTRDGGASAVMAGEGSIMRVKEIKR